MQKTLFAGLTVLSPDDSILTDDGAFIGRDRDTIDRFLEIGAKTHRHTGLAGLPNPELELEDVTVIPSGGTIAGDTTFTLGYTLVDAEGGETKLSPTSTVTTPGALEQPLFAPTAEIDYTAGGLLTDTYYYELTFIDSEGGETPPGAWVSIEREPGFPNARVLLSDISAGVVSGSATGWRLYRAVGGGTFDYLASGGSAVDTFTDDGTISPNCDIHPPPDEVNTTNQINQLRVKLPSASMLGSAASFRLYATNTGTFLGDVLLDAYPLSSAGQTVFFDRYAPDPGAPPDRNHSIGGASKIDPDTDILDWHWKRPVATIGALPSGDKGDVRLVFAASALYYLPQDGDNSDDWDLLAAGGGGGSASGPWTEIVAFGDRAPDVAFLGADWSASAGHQGPEYRVEDDILRMRGMISKGASSGATGETVVSLPSALGPPEKVTHAGVLASYLDVIPGASARLMQNQTHADLNELQYAIDQSLEVPVPGGAYMLFAGDDVIDRGIWAVVGELFQQSVVAILDGLPDDLQGLAYDAQRDRFYFASYTNGIYYVTGAGGEAQTPQLLDTTGATVAQPSDVAIDVAGERLFWSNQSGAISYCDLDGGNGGDLDTTGASVVVPFWVAIDNDAGRIYWVDDNLGSYTIQYADLDGGNGGELDTTGATDLATAWDLAIDTANGRIFFAYDGSNGIEYADLAPTGGNTGVVDDTGATAFESLTAVAVAGDRLYWLNRATGGGVISSTDLATLSDAQDYFVPDIPAGDLLSFGFVFIAL